MQKKPKSFKKSKDSGFCIRNRLLSQSSSYSIRYLIPFSSISLSPTQLNFHLESFLDPAPFLTCTLSFYSSSTFRLEITELCPLHPRYTLPNSFFNLTSPLPLPPSTLTSSLISFTTDDLAVLISLSPFSLRASYKGTERIVINERSLMNFERYRKKGDQMNHKGHDLVDSSGIGDGTGLWEESFYEYVDEKPKGPSSVGVDLRFCGVKEIFGLPVHTDSLALKDTEGGEPYRLFNLDAFKYKINKRAGLYGSMPFLYSNTSGIFWANASDTWVDIRTVPDAKQTHIYSESGVFDLFCFFADSPMEVIETFTMLTGPPALPPLFSLGFHQCRWNYFSQKEVCDIVTKFKYFKIPIDVIWLDIEHTDKKNYFTWHPENFADPLKMLDFCALNGVKVVNIVDPHFRIESSETFNKKIREQDLFVKDINGRVFEAKCWPGMSGWVDFLNADACEEWANQLCYSNYLSSSHNLHIWIDMNEPAVFYPSEKTMPRTNLHANNIEHRDVHNIYGLSMQMATYTGLLRRDNNKKRPFILSRSFFAGSQKYCAVWTGDNFADRSNLMASVPMCLSIAAGGISLCGADVGGFFGEPSANLMVRWFQLGSFLPFFRAHSNIRCKYREPWVYNEDTTDKIRFAIYVRYKLLPYWYTLFYFNFSRGTPVIRSLYLQYTDEELSGINDQFHLGDALMVKAVDGLSDTAQVVFPQGRWFDFYSYKELFGSVCSIDLDAYKLPVFLRGGNVIFTRKPEESTTLMCDSPYQALAAVDLSGKASGRVYRDDGESFEHVAGSFMLGRLEIEPSRISYSSKDGFHKQDYLEKLTVLGLPQVSAVTPDPSLSISHWSSEPGLLQVFFSSLSIASPWSLTLAFP